MMNTLKDQHLNLQENDESRFRFMDKEQVTEAVANMSVGASTSVLIVAYIEQHHTFFTSMASCLGVLFAGLFYLYTGRLKKLQQDIERDKIEIERSKLALEQKKFYESIKRKEN